MNCAVPILISLDVHCCPAPEKEIALWLRESLKKLDNFSIKATFFLPAVFAEKFARDVRMILDEGHEIGCHGLTHDHGEQYNLMPYNKQKATLYEAKKRIEEVTTSEIVSFRSPSYKINGNTIRALQENGFRVDSSVNPQRLGILSSDLTNIGWMYSPRKAYHPGFNNPFIAGEASLWEIPQSAFIFPFMSNTGMAFGGAFMKLFFRMLYTESSFKGNQIVYMFHPEDICPNRYRRRYKFKWRHLLPSRRIGFEVRYALLDNKDPKKTSRQIISLLEMMKNSNNIKFITFGEMLTLLENKNKRIV
ncbi:MAG: polysaccharide deacetylase family protein [Candidatus Omnitrophica bacterium]|nr:polysaccharide deacetylase family protein [Candidatus Omnitrophota bacterium]